MSDWQREGSNSSRQQSRCATVYYQEPNQEEDGESPTPQQKPVTIRPAISQEVANHRWLLTQPPVASRELSSIESQARAMWSMDYGFDTQQSTSYGGHYGRKELDEPTLSRPTSPTRKNNPHPPQIFLTTRLHCVPGFHNVETTIGKSPYQMDASVPLSVRLQREAAREKFCPRVKTPAVPPLQSEEVDRTPYFLQEDARPKTTMVSDIRSSSKRFERPLIGSLHRTLRYAGPMESEHWANATQPKACASAQQQRTTKRGGGVYHHYHGYFGDEEPSHPPYLHQPRLIYQPTTMRGDFLIHPKWPTTLKHHRVPLRACCD